VKTKRIPSKVTVRRLRKLAAFLRELPRRKFDFGTWARDPGNPDPRIKLDPHDRKTVACAAGWATCIPEFKRAGLRLRNGIPSMPSGAAGSHAMAEVLGIDERIALQYFVSPYYYDVYISLEVTPKKVARGLERLADDYESGRYQ
jgi:hypothetical protein